MAIEPLRTNEPLPRWWAISLSLALFVVFFGLVLWLVPTVPVGYADSDEFLIVAATSGVPHPPGYPLLSGLVVLAGKLPLPLTFPTKIHLVSGLLQSLTLLLVFWTSRRLLSRLISDQRLILIAAVIGAMSLATSFDYLLHSLFIEVFALNTFLAMLVVSAIVHWANEQPAPRASRWLMAAAFTFGLGLSNQQTIVLLTPLLALWVFHHDRRWFVDPRRLGGLVGCAALGLLLPYLYVVVVSRLEPVYSWAGAGTISDLMRLLTRQIYAAPDGSATAYVNPDWSFSQALHGLGPFVAYLFRNATITPLVLAGYALIRLWQTKVARPLFWLLFLGLVGGGLFFALYAPVDWTAVGSDHPLVIPAQYERFFLLALPFVALLTSLGVGFVLTMFRPGWRQGMAAILILVTIGVGTIHVRALRQNNWTVAEQYGRTILASVPSQALVICRSDLPCFAGLYLQTVEKLRPDVLFIGLNFRQKTPAQINQAMPQAIKTTSTAPPDLLADLIRWQIDDRPIFLVGFHPFIEQLAELNLAGNPFFVIPRGCLVEVSQTFRLAEPLAGCDQLDRVLGDGNWAAKNGYQALFRATLVEQRLLAAQLFALHACSDQALGELDRLAAVIPSHLLLRQARTAIEQIAAENARCPDQTNSLGLEELTAQVGEHRSKGEFAAAAQLLRQATLIDPNRLDLRLELAKTLEAQGQRDRAVLELHDLLVLDQGYAEAKQLLVDLEQSQ